MNRLLTSAACSAADLAILLVVLLVLLNVACAPRSTLPPSISSQEFWRLTETLSEPAGAFTLSDNLVSNEPHYANSVRWLRPGGGVYIGVGPEQNFSYIASLRPALAFIVDIRRENLALHLLYKALFELSSDRVEFVSRLFSRPRPAGLSAAASVDEIFATFGRIPASPEEYRRNSGLVRELLVATRALPLTPADIQWIDRAFSAFYADGPDIDFYGDRALEAVRPSYRELMTSRDPTGQARSFLASEEAFRFVKGLHTKNLIVPVVGDFGGSSALRRVGEYVAQHDAHVRAVYASNVSVYLTHEKSRAFCTNLEALPRTSSAWFIESSGMRRLDVKLKACAAAPTGN